MHADNAREKVFSTLRAVLDRRGDDIELTLDSELLGVLEMDSLEVGDFSAALEEALGTDPFSQGESPRTVGDVVDFYSR